MAEFVAIENTETGEVELVRLFTPAEAAIIMEAIEAATAAIEATDTPKA